MVTVVRLDGCKGGWVAVVLENREFAGAVQAQAALVRRLQAGQEGDHQAVVPEGRAPAP